MMGYGGVDFFMFLSGFGLFASYYNRTDITTQQFYYRRILRIIPTYFICIIVFGLIRKVSLVDILWQMTCIGFYIGKSSYDWYIQAALALYFLLPFIIASSKKIGIGKTIIIGCIIGLIMTSILIYLWKGSVILFTSRIPVFFIGCYFGYLFTTGTKIKHDSFLIIVSCLSLLVEWYLTFNFEPIFLFRSSLSTLPFIFIVPGMCLLLAKLFDVLPQAFCKPIVFLGSITLEIYLCHMSLRFIIPNSKFVLPIVVGIALHYFVVHLTHCISFLSKHIEKTHH